MHEYMCEVVKRRNSTNLTLVMVNFTECLILTITLGRSAMTTNSPTLCYNSIFIDVAKTLE